MRMSWGWYLNLPYGTGSTFPEGYLTDGTFGYRATSGYDNDYSYPSHAHGWSTGPTDALTSFIVGLRLTSPGGATFTLAPQFGDLSAAEGGFTAGLGTFNASWTLVTGGYTLGYTVPDGSSGTLVLPGEEGSSSTPTNVTVDGAGVDLSSGTWNGTSGVVTIAGAGGSHSVVVVY